MQQGHPWRNTLVQLGVAHHSASDKETVFLNNVRALGFTLNTRVQMKTIHISDCSRDHAVLPVKDLATEILAHHPHLLFFGHGYKDLATVEATLSTFWTRFRHVWPHHEVYSLHRARLCRCIPCRIHADEGTSFRRAGIYQQSWGPVLKAAPASWAHCYFYSCVLLELYKDRSSCPNFTCNTYIYIYTYMHRDAYTYAGTCTYFKDIYTYTYTGIHMYIYIHIHIHIHNCQHVIIHIYTFTFTHTSSYSYIQKYRYSYTYTYRKDKDAHIGIDTHLYRSIYINLYSYTCAHYLHRHICIHVDEN